MLSGRVGHSHRPFLASSNDNPYALVISKITMTNVRDNEFMRKNKADWLSVEKDMALTSYGGCFGSLRFFTCVTCGIEP